MPSRLTWLGQQVQDKIENAIKVAMNETTGNCVQSAMGLVHVKTRLLQGSIEAKATEKDDEGMLVARWGSFAVNYAYWQEILPPPRGKPYLRPSADIEYPKLAKRIVEHIGE